MYLQSSGDKDAQGDIPKPKGKNGEISKCQAVETLELTKRQYNRMKVNK